MEVPCTTPGTKLLGFGADSCPSSTALVRSFYWGNRVSKTKEGQEPGWVFAIGRGRTTVSLNSRSSVCPVASEDSSQRARDPAGRNHRMTTLLPQMKGPHSHTHPKAGGYQDPTHLLPAPGTGSLWRKTENGQMVAIGVPLGLHHTEPQPLNQVTHMLCVSTSQDCSHT